MLNGEEYREECQLASEYEERVAQNVTEVLLPVFRSGYVRLPGHLKSVPKWQQYMYCGDSVPMAVIYQAREKGLFLKEAEYPVPAALLVYKK